MKRLLLFLPFALGAQTLLNSDVVVVGGLNYCSDAGSTDAYACALPRAITAYQAGQQLLFRANTANTGGATVNFNSVGAIAIKKSGTSGLVDPADGEICAGCFTLVVYTGTVFQMVGAPGTSSSGGAGAANYAVSFTSQTSVTASHAMGTKNIVVDCYDASDIRIDPHRVTSTSTSAAAITFLSAQSGYCVVNGSGGAGISSVSGTANQITCSTSSGAVTCGAAAALDYSGLTSTKPMKAGTTAPGTCTVGEMFFDTDATAGSNLYACTSTNTWTLQAGGGGGSTLSIPFTIQGNGNLGNAEISTTAHTGVCHRFSLQAQHAFTKIALSVATVSGTCAGTCGFAVALYDSSKARIAQAVMTSGGTPNYNTLGAKQLSLGGTVTMAAGKYYVCYASDSIVAQFPMVNLDHAEAENNGTVGAEHGYQGSLSSGSGGSITLPSTLTGTFNVTSTGGRLIPMVLLP